ncbi:MAG TPA: hypothetical protein VHC20_01405 [Candidatus Paceibacterota bacterium]|nr:hypothetical protein [Candidatus Paceibacterota bacterium]
MPELIPLTVDPSIRLNVAVSSVQRHDNALKPTTDDSVPGPVCALTRDRDGFLTKAAIHPSARRVAFHSPYGYTKSVEAAGRSDTSTARSHLCDGYAISAIAHAALVYAQDPLGELPDLGEITVPLDRGLMMIRRSMDALGSLAP